MAWINISLDSDYEVVLTVHINTQAGTACTTTYSVNHLSFLNTTLLRNTKANYTVVGEW